MNKLLHVRPVVIARRSVALVKQDKNELSVNVSDTKWNIVYSSGQQNHTMACRRQKLRYCLRKLAQIFPAIFIFRTFIFMGTGYEHMLLDLRDIEGFLYFGIFLSLLEYYTIPGSQINAIYVDQDAKFIRIEKVVDSSGAIQTQVVPRSKITAVKAEQVQATLPIIKGSKKIDSLALTSKATIHDPLIFELIFGPYAYNSYQYFQVELSSWSYFNGCLAW